MGAFHLFKKKTKYILTEKDKRWNRFIEELCSRDIYELSAIQKNAVLCFRYDAEMNNGGHCLYFDCHKDIEPRELIDAILTVGCKEIADNFEKAVAEGEKDDWIETDNTYYDFSPSLLNCLMDYVERHKDEIFV